MTSRLCAAIVAGLAGAALISGCGAGRPDYQAVWNTNTTTAAAADDGAQVPLKDYLTGKGVTGQPVAPSGLPDLTVSIPTPPGWSPRRNPKLPPTTEVIGAKDGYPAAILTALKLSGKFDPADAIKHGYDDTTLAQNFKLLDSSNADFGGFPSTMIQGSHDLGGQRLHSWSRTVIATGSSDDDQRYLIQLTISTLADRAAAQAADVETVIEGFTVAGK